MEIGRSTIFRQLLRGKAYDLSLLFTPENIPGPFVCFDCVAPLAKLVHKADST